MTTICAVGNADPDTGQITALNLFPGPAPTVFEVSTLDLFPESNQPAVMLDLFPVAKVSLDLFPICNDVACVLPQGVKPAVAKRKASESKPVLYVAKTYFCPPCESLKVYLAGKGLQSPKDFDTVETDDGVLPRFAFAGQTVTGFRPNEIDALLTMRAEVPKPKNCACGDCKKNCGNDCSCGCKDTLADTSAPVPKPPIMPVRRVTVAPPRAQPMTSSH